jgi:tight adherence protein B
MTATAVGLTLGLGLLLVLLAIVDPRPMRSAPSWRPSLPGRPVAALLASAGVTTVSTRGLLSLATLAGLVAGAVMLAVSGTPPVAVVFGLLAAYAPVALLRGRAARRRREFADLWPEAVDNLASAVRAGLSLPEAVTQLGERGPEPLRTWFRDFGADYLATGRFDDCLGRLKDAMADPVADRVCEALRIARAVGGGDLGRVLRSLSRFLRDDVRTRNELESRQAWVVNGARLAVASPWIVLLALSFQRTVITRYSSTAGVVVLVTGAGCCLVAYRLMLRLGQLPAERRVLA